MFLLVPAYPGCPGSKAVKRSLLLLLLLRAVNKPLLFICAIHNSNAISRVRPFVFSHSYFLHQLTFGLDLLASVWVMTITRQGAKVDRPSDVVLLLADRPERSGGALPRRRLRPALQQRARVCG